MVFLIIIGVIIIALVAYHDYKEKKYEKSHIHAQNSTKNTLDDFYSKLINGILHSYRNFSTEDGLILHQMPLIEGEYIRLFYYCLMLDITKLFDSEAITNNFSDNYWRSAKSKGFSYEDTFTNAAKQHFSSIDNLKTDEEEIEEYITAFCEKAFQMYKFKDGSFNEDLVIPMLLSETFMLHQNTREKIRNTFMDISSYYLSSMSESDRNRFMQRHDIDSAHQSQPNSDTFRKKESTEKSLLLKIGISIGEAPSKSKVHTNLYTKLDFTIYIFFNLYISFGKALKNGEACQKFEENFRNAFITFSTEKLGIDEDFADEFYCDRLSTYNDIMMSESANKDDALMASLEQFIQKDIQKEYFSKDLIVCDIAESINDTLSYTLLYGKVMEDITPTFNKIIEFYK